MTDRRSRPASRPPAGTPATAELANRARASLADAVRLARWAELHLGAGDGGRPAPAGALPAADVERAAGELGLTHGQIRVGWDRARLAGLVEVHGGHARPGWRLRAWDRDDTAVLRGWVALFDAWSLVHPAPADIAPAVVAEVVEAMPQLLSLLQLSAGPVTVPDLLDLLGQRVTELRDERCEVPYDAPSDASGPSGVSGSVGVPGPSGPADGSDAADGGDDAERAAGAAAPVPLARLLRWALGGLAAVDAVTLGPARATLTPLGSWAVWVKLEQICVAAQSPAGNIEQSAAAMLHGCARLTPGPARAEYQAWLAARPVGHAVAELLQAARGEDALLRGLAFEALRVVGAPAEPEVRATVREPALRPYALLWLAEHDGVDPDDAQDVLTAEESTWLWVDTAAAIADHGEAELLARHLDSAVRTTVPRLLDEVRAVGHPRTVQVLVALAAAHPDPALAKAVRRAAFQVHTGGA
ncbi:MULTISPECIES: hypothetical protein [unclassified Streptomyces]|uniref:hypothetical protein n=1 Tax=unclassified Streptomyces TaxID=2593676 RepID=UPI0022510A96|nr:MULTISPECIES: hypothetical protein [unclassified Streptomyces]MCX4525178.1 hypothetical protein [Streptomyces sp. NBC_01551]MCX4544310.1 hypothetical protein [Streptomyces sp. NBC_01565]